MTLYLRGGFVRIGFGARISGGLVRQARFGKPLLGSYFVLFHHHRYFCVQLRL